jgi:hypothetical protein
MLKKLIKITVTLGIVLIVGIALLVSLVVGGIGLVKNTLGQFSIPNINLSSIIKLPANPVAVPKGYKTINSTNLAVASILTAESDQNKQRIILINPGPFLNITKQDIQSNDIESQIRRMMSIGPVQIINLDKFEIVKKGTFKIAQQEIPYVKGSFGILGGSKVPSEGIIGVFDTASSKNTILISTADSGKFNLKTVEDFLKQVK